MHQIHIQSFVAAARAEVRHALLHRTEVVLDALPEPRWPGPRVEVSPESLTVPWPHTAPLGAPTEMVVDLDEAIGGYFAAWLQALAALGLLVERGVDARPAAALRGAERHFASGEIPSLPDSVWRSLGWCSSCAAPHGARISRWRSMACPAARRRGSGRRCSSGWPGFWRSRGPGRAAGGWPGPGPPGGWIGRPGDAPLS